VGSILAGFEGFAAPSACLIAYGSESAAEMATRTKVQLSSAAENSDQAK
jgi:hypothetical protein